MKVNFEECGLKRLIRTPDFEEFHVYKKTEEKGKY